MKCKALRQIELDRIAPGPKHGARNPEDKGVLDDRLCARRTSEKPSEPFGTSTIEAAVAEWSLLEILAEIGIERGDLRSRQK